MSSRSTVAVLLVIIFGLCVGLAYALGTRASPTLASDPVVDAGASTSNGMFESSKPAPVADDAPGSEPETVYLCYHLDSCRAAKLARPQIVQERDGIRLMMSRVEFGEVPDPDSEAVKWSGKIETLYALCSAQSPLLIMKDDVDFLAEEFDLSSGDVPGVQWNNSELYGVICHANDKNWRENVKRYGYRELIDGGRGQFSIARLSDAFATSN